MNNVHACMYACTFQVFHAHVYMYIYIHYFIYIELFVYCSIYVCMCGRPGSNGGAHGQRDAGTLRAHRPLERHAQHYRPAHRAASTNGKEEGRERERGGEDGRKLNVGEGHV
jgi:hypothetical protein